MNRLRLPSAALLAFLLLAAFSSGMAATAPLVDVGVYLDDEQLPLGCKVDAVASRIPDSAPTTYRIAITIKGDFCPWMGVATDLCGDSHAGTVRTGFYMRCVSGNYVSISGVPAGVLPPARVTATWEYGALPCPNPACWSSTGQLVWTSA